MKKGIIGGLIGLVILAVGGYFAFTGVADDKLKERADKFVASLNKQPGMNVTYGSVKSDVVNQGMIINNVVVDRGAKGTVKIDRVEIKDYDWINEQPRHATIAVRGIQLPMAELSKGNTGALSKMGYSNVVLNATMNYLYDPDKKTLVVKQFQVDGNDIGTLSLQFSYGNVPQMDQNKDQFDPKKNPKAMMMFMQMTIVSASISFKDNSLVSRLLKAHAAEKNISEAEAKTKILAEIDGKLKTVKSDLEREGLRAARKFVENPGTISITLSPPRPVPMMMFMAAAQKGGAQVKQMFGVNITAN